MIRVIIYLVIVGLLAYGAARLADRPGDVTITWQNTRIETSVMVLIAAVAAVASWQPQCGRCCAPSCARPNAVGSICDAARVRGLSLRCRKAWSRSAPATRARRAGSRTRRRASRRTSRSRCLLGAQASQLAGDREAAERTFHAMAARDDTRLLGLHGLFIEAQRRNDSRPPGCLQRRRRKPRARRPGPRSRCSMRAAPPATGSARWKRSTATTKGGLVDASTLPACARCC